MANNAVTDRCYSKSRKCVLSNAEAALMKRDANLALHLLESVSREPYEPQCAALRWTCYMLLGYFERAWRESDYIARQGSGDELWDGTHFDGKRVIIRCLHGLGDAIQFVRYAPLVHETASSVTVQSHPELVPLLASAQGVDRAITWQHENAAEWDMQVEVMELPRIFRTTVQTIPRTTPYLHPERLHPEHLKI